MVPDVLPSYPSLLEPSLDPGSLKKSILRLNEVVEMMTGQRGKAEYSLQEGMLSIRKSLTIQNTTIEASIREINEVMVSADEALAQRTTIIEAEIENARGGSLDLAARITSVDLARVTGDSALASSITTVETQVGAHTASIAVIQSSVDGMAVKFGVMGYINGVTGGFVFTGVLQNDGSVSYNMEFYSNVIIHGDLIVVGTVSNPKITDNAVTNNAAASGPITPGGGYINTGITVREGARLLLQAHITEYVGTSFHAGTSSLGVQTDVPAIFRSYEIGMLAQGAYHTFGAWDVVVSSQYGGFNASFNDYYIFNGACAACSGGVTVGPLTAGTYFPYLKNNNASYYMLGIIIATELAK